MGKALVLELGFEEIPAQFVDLAQNTFEANIRTWLKENRLDYDQLQGFSTPRRFGVIVSNLKEEQPDAIEKSRGPAVSIAKDENGEWTKAAIGFAKGKGLDVDDLTVEETEQGTYVYAVKKVSGVKTIDLLKETFPLFLNIPFPKSMRWGSNKTRYVRPIHWLVALYGDAVVDGSVAGIKAGRTTRGHRFLGETIDVLHADEFEEKLLSEYVIVDPTKRQDAIRQQIGLLEEEHNWNVDVEEGLLQEVTNLVEYPTALFGSFSEEFLQLPDEVLITSMREHQRYFAVHSQAGELLPYFITVRNGDHRHLENIRRGNEKVLRARLSDGVFFYKEDQKHSLDTLVSRMDVIVEHEKIGTIKEKSERTKQLVEKLSSAISESGDVSSNAARAAELLKIDLSTNMVDEFPELQGLMGSDYANRLGENEKVATAIREHYLPRFVGDDLPTAVESALVSVSDKLDTITSSFAIGLKPTGSQDPYGLRRQAAAIVNVTRHFKLSFTYEALRDYAIEISNAAAYPSETESLKDDLDEFFKLRLKAALEERGISYDIIEAILVSPFGRIDVLFDKADVLQELHDTKRLKDVTEALSRVNNIAKKQEGPADVQVALFEKDEERELYDAYVSLKDALGVKLLNGEVSSSFEELEKLAPVIHRYFEGIMVMSDNDQLKQNRLAQMQVLSLEISRFAQFQALVLPS
ncbi:glycine--tRNA ligase subunit beta [Geomicrobium sp. JCM 19038]|uniref:glycine--tRNA ligase subunit beta n=1 Tax=Geomicrobium sp. JCM 19038 TaxID=1460635 RepID=UPI00045F399D|nr:glycine--tRNA ligase subunit beta [Geomicrobium sp. JCM 19038]GAK06445.1 glycyl-tRNA synthetase beta chain [Geomicrobium sp. JCM 19038]